MIYNLFIIYRHDLFFILRLNNRGELLGPSDLEWWFNPASMAWNEATFNPGGVAAEGIRPNRFLQVKFAVSVNTSHPSIQKQIKTGFRQAESFLVSKKSFCLEVSVIKNWKYFSGYVFEVDRR